MYDSQGRALVEFRAHGSDATEADRQVQSLADLSSSATQFDDRVTYSARVYDAHNSVSVDRVNDLRFRQVGLVIVHEVSRTTERLHHAGELPGCLPVHDHFLAAPGRRTPVRFLAGN